MYDNDNGTLPRKFNKELTEELEVVSVIYFMRG